MNDPPMQATPDEIKPASPGECDWCHQHRERSWLGAYELCAECLPARTLEVSPPATDGEIERLIAKCQKAKANGDPAKYISGLSVADAHSIADHLTRISADNAVLREAAERALNYIANTEGEFGIKLESGDLLRAARQSKG